MSESRRSVTMIGQWGIPVTVPVSAVSGTLSPIQAYVYYSTGNAYWVSPTGTATWANAYHASAPDIADNTKHCSLATANANVNAGDKVYLRGGNYPMGTALIRPSRTGYASSKISYVAYASETPNFTDTGISRSWVIWIESGKNYIVVDGIHATTVSGFIYIYTSGYNEIKNCVMTGRGGLGGFQQHAIYIQGSAGSPSTHNWIHDNTFSTIGLAGQWDMMKIDEVPEYGTGNCNNNTIEGNHIFHAGHTVGATFSLYNVFKNNHYHNEGWISGSGTYGPDSNGYYGHRCLELYDGRSRSGVYCLVEDNRFSSCGPPPDSDGGECITVTSPRNIIRFNKIINAQNNGIFMKDMPGSRSDNNRIFNNTVVWAGRYHNTGPAWQGYSICFEDWYSPPPVGNVFKNNLMWGATTGDYRHAAGSGSANTFSNNWLNASGDPLFVDTTHSDLTSATQPNLHLQASSPCIGGGAYLTQANGSGNNSATLVVDDALYFQDGTWGSSLASGVTMFPDEIAIGTVSNTVAISSINYSTNTITLSSPKTWSDNDNIWLYKNSAGTRVLYGSAPEYGAYPYST